jgi:hypothetical protein
MAGRAAAMGVHEPVCVPFAADAAEALIALGRTEEAGVLVDRLEEHGRRLDRAWALATGGRCRSLLLAAGGQLEAAVEAAARALAGKAEDELVTWRQRHEDFPGPAASGRAALPKLVRSPMALLGAAGR